MCCNIRSFLTGILVFRDVKRQLCALLQKWDYVLHTNVPLNHLHDHPCHCRHFAVRERHKQFRTFVAFRTFALQTATLHDPKDPAIEYSSIPMSGKYVHKARLSKLVSIFGPSTENTLKWYRSKSLIPSNASDVIIHQEQKDLAYLKLPHRKPKDGAVQCTMHHAWSLCWNSGRITRNFFRVPKRSLHFRLLATLAQKRRRRSIR